MTTIDRAALPGIDYAAEEISESSPAISLGNCTGIWIENSDSGSERVLMYLHAGGSRCCVLGSHRRLLSRISAALQASVLVIDYRTPPDNAISDGVDDAVSCYQGLLAAGYDGEQIVLAMDSADIDLTMMVPMAIRGSGLSVPASVVAISPLPEEADLRRPSGVDAQPCCALEPSARTVAA